MQELRLLASLSALACCDMHQLLPLALPGRGLHQLVAAADSSPLKWLDDGSRHKNCLAVAELAPWLATPGCG